MVALALAHVRLDQTLMDRQLALEIVGALRLVAQYLHVPTRAADHQVDREAIIRTMSLAAMVKETIEAGLVVRPEVHQDGVAIPEV